MEVLKPKIDQILLSLGYNYYNTKEDARQEIEGQVSRERKSGNKFVNHLYTSNLEEPYVRKHFNPIYFGNDFKIQVPLCMIARLRAEKSDASKISIMGDDQAASLEERFSSFLKAKRGVKSKGVYVSEGPLDKVSRRNSLDKGMSVLSPKSGINTLDIPGDAPELDIQLALEEPRNRNADYVMALNNLNVAGSDFPRNYHLAGVDDNTFLLKLIANWSPYPVLDGILFKESQYQVLDYGKMIESTRFGSEIYDLFFGARKEYGKNSGQISAFKQVCFYDAEGNSDILNGIGALSSLGFGPTVQLVGSLIAKKRGIKLRAVLPLSAANRLSRHVFGSKFTTKAFFSQDPGAIIDIDSREDMIFYQSLRQNHIYSIDEINDLQEFSKYTNGDFGIHMHEGWHERSNNEFDEFGIPARYTTEGELVQKLFSPARIARQANRIVSYRENRGYNQ